MKRSTGIAVLATAAVLIAAGNLPRLPWDAFAAAWRTTLERSVAAWPTRARLDAPRHPAPRAALATPSLATPRWGVPAWSVGHEPVWQVPEARLPDALAHPGPAVSGVAAVLATLTLVGALAGAGRRDRRDHVFRMARHGHAAASIARRTRVAQDAVRTLLTPGIGARR